MPASSKTLEKLHNALGKDTTAELEGLDSEALRKRIVGAQDAMKKVQEELDANPDYQELKANKKALEEGKRDVNKRQRAITALCLHLLEERGE